MVNKIKKRKRAKGGGRKKLPYTSVTMRIPAPMELTVLGMVHRFKKEKSNES